MKKENIIKKNYEITEIINKRNCVKNKYFSIYTEKNNNKKSRFAICISTKVGNAVKRNKIKRRIKDIIDKNNLIFKTSTDYVIIIKKEVNKLDYNQIKSNLLDLISKID